MKVKCLAEYPNAEQRSRLGKGFNEKQDFHVTVGREYVVLGMEFYVDSSTRGTGVWVAFLCDYEHLTSAPLCMFTITDPRVSRFWECRDSDSNIIVLWPPSFYREYYHDDLSEDVKEVVEDFRQVRALIEGEFLDTPSSEVGGDNREQSEGR